MMSMQLASTALLVLVVFAGFSIVKDSIPPWWIWAYYLSPLSWGLQAIVVNEMTQERWDVPLPGGGDGTVGVVALQTFDMRTEREFIWWGALYHLATFLVMTGLTALVLAVIENPRTPSVVPDPEVLAKYREVSSPCDLSCRPGDDQSRSLRRSTEAEAFLSSQNPICMVRTYGCM